MSSWIECINSRCRSCKRGIASAKPRGRDGRGNIIYKCTDCGKEFIKEPLEDDPLDHTPEQGVITLD